MKRFFTVLLSVFLCINFIITPVYASGTGTENKSWYERVWDGSIQLVEDASDIYDLSGVNWLTYAEVYRICYTSISGFGLVVSTYDAKAGLIGAGMDYFCNLIKSGKTPTEAITTMSSDINVNGDGNTVIVGDGNTFLEKYYDDKASDIGYVTRYIMGYQDLNPVWFDNYNTYNAFQNLVKGHPDKLIQFSNTGNLAYGSVNFYYSEKPLLGAVIPDKSTWGYSALETTFYADDWTTNFTTSDGVVLACQGYFSNIDNSSLSVAFLDNETGIQTFGVIFTGSQEELKSVDVLALAKEYETEHNCTIDTRYMSFYGYSFGSIEALDDIYNHNIMTFNDYLVFSGSRVAFPCFQTLNDLKKGSIGKSTTPLLPNFNGNSINGPVTAEQVQQAEEIVNNYYENQLNNKDPGGSGNNGSGNNGSGNNGSGSSIWDKLADLVSGLLGFIVDALTSALDALKNVFNSITGFFDGVVDLVGSGFADLMASFFPYIPSEWITIVGLVLGLSVFFFILKHFL